jgi:hypothetical protein
MSTNTNIPNWKAAGDWFDVCKCSIPCPCEFTQTPTYGDCEGVLAYHIKKGNYGQTTLDGLNILAMDTSRVISGQERQSLIVHSFLMNRLMKNSVKH